MRVPFVVYADFEYFTEKLDTMQPNPKKSYTKQYQKHTPSGFCYYIKCYDDMVYSQNPVIYTKQSEDEDVAQTFVEMLEKDLKVDDFYKCFGRDTTMNFQLEKYAKELKIPDFCVYAR